MSEIRYLRYKDFERSLNSLWKRGGRYQKAADQVWAAMGRCTGGNDPFTGLPITHHGETRIQHCVKYDLTGFARLITVQNEGWAILLFCGTHDDCDQWLDANKGMVPVVAKGDEILVTYASREASESARLSPQGGHSVGPLLERLEPSLVDRLVEGIPRTVVRRLEKLEAGVEEGSLWSELAPISHDAKRLALHDVLALLARDDVTGAELRAKQILGEVEALSDIPVALLPELIDSATLKTIRPGSAAYPEAMRRFMASARYRDWMLYMHPEQERVVQEDFPGSAKLVGVSGSGKTCVVVQRAVRLAEKYGDGQVLVLTLNRALAGLISELVDECASKAVRPRIEVKPFFALCRELLLEFNPTAGKQYGEVTWKTNEHVDEVWLEYYRCEVNNNDAAVFAPVHDSLLSRSWSPDRYLREELDWIRSAAKPGNRASYLRMPRKGRTVNLTETFRRAVLEGLKGWETKLKDVGVMDALGIAQALGAYLPKLIPRYRCILVDEAQDFGNVELEIVRRLVAAGENDLFICGDAAQAVTTKYQSFKQVGIEIASAHYRKLNQNYRNSFDVLKAAYAVLHANMDENLLDREDFEVLDPEYSTFSAATPLLLEGESLRHELGSAVAFARDSVASSAEGKACIAICGYSLNELAKYGTRVGLPVLDGATSIDNGQVFISDLEQTKGFEFDTVIIVNCSDGTLPAAAAPPEECFRDLARVYVAMTRAKKNLVISWSKSVSPFLRDASSHFLAAKWAEYLTEAITPMSVPRRTTRSSQAGRKEYPWQESTGSEILHRPEALGVSLELSTKLRDLVDGVGLRQNGVRLKWKDMGGLAEDLRLHRKTRQTIGPAVSQELEAFLSRLPKVN